MFSWHNFKKCASFFNLLISSWDIKLKKTTGSYLQAETTFFLFFRDLKNYRTCRPFFSVENVLLTYFFSKLSFFFKKKKRAGFCILVNISVKYLCLVDDNKTLFSTTNITTTLLFKKGGLLIFQLSATLVCTVLHTAEQLISHLWTISPLKLTIFSRTEVKGMEREPFWEPLHCI